MHPIRNIVILGGGTSGWMTAAALAHFFSDKGYSISLIESAEIGTVGVGEATLPHLRFFNQTLGIDEREFMRATHATYKMGIEFSHWGNVGDAYIHPFGEYGYEIGGLSFHHYWLKNRFAGDLSKIDKYSLPVMAAAKNKFLYPSEDERSILATYSYAFHLDAGLYAKFLRKYCEDRKVLRIEGKVVQVNQNEDGNITSLVLDDERVIQGDLFIDCSGFRGVLIEQTLKTGYEDWSHWLPCNRAIAIPCESHGTLLPYTKATARDAGWQWRIPLQHRTGNGHVYCNDFIGDEAALETLVRNLDGKPIADPNYLHFTTGKRKKAWNKNVIAIGLAGGFLEPLESTSIYLVQIAIMKLMELFPSNQLEQVGIDEYNRLIDLEYFRIRDFLILHYHATNRKDTEFWNYCRNMNIPDELAHKMKMFRERGYVVKYEGGLFLEPSWVAVYLGQGIIPQRYDARADRISKNNLEKVMAEQSALVERASNDMPLHEDVLRHNLGGGLLANAVPVASMSLYGVRND